MSVTPPPSALEPTAPPPWPEPEGLITYDDDPHGGMGCGLLGLALVPLLLAFFSRIQSHPNYVMHYGGLVVAAVLVLFGWRRMVLSKRELPARQARRARSRRAWARVKSSQVMGQTHSKQGARYELALELEVWLVDPAAATHRTAPTHFDLRVGKVMPGALAPHVVPGAFFGVAYDPEQETALPFALLTRDGVQFPL